MKMAADALRLRATSIVVVACATGLLAACQSGSSTHSELAPADDAPAFTAAEYGVAASPRVTNLKQVRKGGGREQVGKPYKVRGKWYYPKEEEDYSRSGRASWYGSNFHGRLTANGEVYDMYHLSAAHPTFPLPSYARVTNKSNGHSVLVRVNDRGPYAHGRIVDLSSRAADLLDFKQAGIADVQVDYVGRAPVEGDDTAMLMASYQPGQDDPASDGMASGVMVASAERPSDEVLVASAFSATGTAPASMPGVRSMKAIQQNAPQRPVAQGGFSMPASYPTAYDQAPTPTPRAGVLSYAPDAPVHSKAFQALAAVAAGTHAETIEIGILDGEDTVRRIAAFAAPYGEVAREALPAEMGEGVSLTLSLNPGADADTIVQALWANGAADAFVVKD